MRSLLFLEALLAIPLAIWVLVSVKRGTVLLPVLLSCFAMGFVAIWLRSFWVQVGHGLLRYHSLFWGTKEIKILDIEEAAVEMGRSSYWDRLRPPFRLVIKPCPGARVKTFDINLRVFPRSDVEALIAFLANPQQVRIQATNESPREENRG